MLGHSPPDLFLGMVIYSCGYLIMKEKTDVLWRGESSEMNDEDSLECFPSLILRTVIEQFYNIMHPHTNSRTFSKKC